MERRRCLVYKDIAINNRLEIITEPQDGNSTLNSHRGIVIEVSSDGLILVSELGDVISIDRDDIIYITKISFDRQISSAIINIKNYYQEKLELENRLNILKKSEPTLIGDLHDATLLSRFNIFGAKNRLDKSMPIDTLNFSRGMYGYNISFGYNPNSEIEIFFKVTNNINYYNNLDNIDVNKITRVHAPDEKEVIEDSFNKLYKVEELQKRVEHEIEDSYRVISLYKLNIKVTEETFVKKREEIIKALYKLKR